MQKKIERYLVKWDETQGKYALWNDDDKAYSRYWDNDGVCFPEQRDVNVISVLVGASFVTPQASIVYPPIDPYRTGRIKHFDPRDAQQNPTILATWQP